MKKILINWMSTWPFWAKNIVYTIWLKTTRAGKVANDRERLVVCSWDELVECGEFYHVMHAHRYYWAGQQIPPGSNVLDLGCGSGYGSRFLAELGNKIVGYDPDVSAIEWAKDHFEHDKLDLHFSNMLENEKFQYIVCFEVIEHDPEIVFNKILEHLERGGTLIISTPNAEPTSVRKWLLDRRKVIINHTHKKEFERYSLTKLFSSYFKEIRTWGQCPRFTRNFYDYEQWRRKRGVKLSDFKLDPEDFVNCEVIVALCKGYKGS